MTSIEPDGLPASVTGDQLLDLLPAAVYTTDRDGRLTLFNQAAVELWGRRPEIGKDLWCGSFRIFRTDGTPLPHDQCPMAVTLREGRSVRGEEIVVQRPDGLRFHILPYPELLRDQSGAIVGAINMLVDVTDRKRADMDRIHLAAIVESSDDAIVSKTLEGVITSWNKAAERIFGYTAQEIIGKPIALLIPPGQANDLAHILGQVRRGERVDHYQTKRRAKDGRIIDVSLTVSPVLDTTGNIVGASKVARDITAQKHIETALATSEEQLREANRRKDEFLAMLAHELRNPLSAISSAVQVARKSVLDEPLAWSTEVIERQSKHLTRLIDDLLDVSRITQGKIQLRNEVVHIGPILNSAVEVVRPLMEERKHELNVSFRPGPLRVHADPVRLEQIGVNLLTNAAKYTTTGGRIWLTAEQMGDDIVIRVRDSGVGIPPEKLTQIFDLFVQDDRSLARSEGGLGIGLTLVKSLVEMQQGTISASSDGRGKGSEFTVRLPAVTSATGETAKAKPAIGTGGPASRILIVDDNADTAKGLARLLRLLGHDIRTANDGPEAIAVVQSYRPDIVLLDIGLPGMDGYEVARRLRNDETGSDCVIVAISGYGQEDDRRRGREAGFDFHLVKPVDPDALLTLLARN
ncbi:PAS domain-containing hybrid sensor histidine kinase/response regulator [Singulisphaera acidiphila]|uniref:histidine kinase n=1 Tax=Singulisphaera acidiphila (strain ATCC BAA-1392 / DSM 18658 / VKM B-2454 / MOB10) TaxID=886293 RepID=L0DBL1_SINAD|nr:PAS domain S-box protein [Singulisphaera acidiphila]AGA26041.1 PAS domain S-box [Singulisphaera acidiphila DSM 18658]